MSKAACGILRYSPKFREMGKLMNWMYGATHEETVCAFFSYEDFAKLTVLAIFKCC